MHIMVNKEQLLVLKTLQINVRIKKLALIIVILMVYVLMVCVYVLEKLNTLIHVLMSK